ncbi:DUF6197 family protein [Streptomyces antarcticus]|uniref:DUF6197 family protein n=1 Tax=Streptomyces antarcticus TaxID=2996458 RepID=UPI0022712F42|nr:hypothetical protein [Streptomyces sp. H34-AA3]MCY0946300.1 hypothetical protein [Streptomyces sp. H34-AA3]
MPASAAPAAFGGTQVPDAGTRLLADEVEAWLKKITPPANPAPTPAPSAPATGFDIPALVAAGLAEVERGERATAAAQVAARPSLLDRITRRHLRPAARASLHIRRAAAALATGGWCRGELRDATGRHCILGALMDAPADADTTNRSHAYIRAAMADPAAYAQPAPAYRARLEAQWRSEGRDPQALSGQFDIAVHNNLSAPTVGAVLDLLQRAAELAERAGD